MDADGSDARLVASDLNLDTTPAFSPNGKRLVFARGATRDIYKVRLDGTGLRQLTTDPGWDREPDWQPRCTMTGTWHDDTLTGTDGPDLICPLGGDDVVSAGRGNDVVFANYGDDVVSGGRGKDILVGGWGEDTLRGNAGDDRLIAGTGETFPTQVDVLYGGRGNDYLDAQDGTGDDTVTGGSGTDICLLDVGDDVSGCP